MVSIIVAANNQDKKFLNAVQNILNRSFKLMYCMQGCVDARCDGAELFLTDAESFDLIYSDTAVVIFKEADKLGVKFETNKQVVAIVDSCNKDVLQLVSKTKLPAITCGLSPRDTITLSSINEDSAVIDLQRSVTCFDGKIVEPQEIPVTLCAPIDSFALMCVAAVFILSGNIAKLFQIEI